MTSVDVVINMFRAVTFYVTYCYWWWLFECSNWYRCWGYESGKVLKIPKNKRPQINRAERKLIVAEAGKNMQTWGMADVSCQIGPSNLIWFVYIAHIGDKLLLGGDIIQVHDITINTKRGLEI